MPFHTQQESAQTAVRTHGGYIIRLDDTGYWHCFRDADVLDLLDGMTNATREDLISYLRDFDFRFLNLGIDEDAPVLYANDVVEYFDSIDNP
jgi:hypothetical protein